MQVDLERGALAGNQGVTGAGPLGVLQADAYELREGDRALVLRGNVRGQIPDRSQQSEETAPWGSPSPQWPSPPSPWAPRRPSPN
jgi:hypothetical protein